MYNVVEKVDVRATDNSVDNQTFVHTEDLQNGSIFVMGDMSTKDGDYDVITAKAPVDATATNVFMAISTPRVEIKSAMGNLFTGLTDDPREFINIAGKPISGVKLHINDRIKIATDKIADVDVAKFLVPEGGTFNLVASPTAGTGLCLEKVGTEPLHIGNPNITKNPTMAYVYRVINN